MVSTVIKNWDNKTWLSSQAYIESFNDFLIKNLKLNSDSQILDIGCGRGKILGNLSSKLKLKKKPIGIDIVNHKDRDKRIHFSKKNALIFFKANKKKFDLILIKQTIHLFNINEIKKLLNLSKKNLKLKGKIFIFTLEKNKNEIPAFRLMKFKLKKSLHRDKKIFNIIKKSYSKSQEKKFIFKVKIYKKKYIKMLHNRYISILLSLTKNEILQGVEEINKKYKNIINFNDKLTCIIL